jgi:hypothetical protein
MALSLALKTKNIKMKTLFSILLVLFIGSVALNAQTNQTKTEVKKESEAKTPVERPAQALPTPAMKPASAAADNNSTKETNQASGMRTNEVQSGAVNKDGTPNRSVKANKNVKKRVTPDNQYKVNQESQKKSN